MERRGWICEWDRLKADLDTLQEVTVRAAGQPFVIRTQSRGGPAGRFRRQEWLSARWSEPFQREQRDDQNARSEKSHL